MNKQIEEMVNDISAMCPDLVNSGCGDLSCVACLAKGLEQMCYHKQSEGENISQMHPSDAAENEKGR